MSLKEYWQKRKFEVTPEPKGEVSKTSKKRFVVQEHHASHLHWDFRLELDGVLKSWAIPKQPPKVTGIKRLAIEVEDHPLSYISFAGKIPEGLYGAGTVKIWDKGMFELVERTGNKIRFVLKGKELDGTYELMRFAKIGEKKWLFFKSA